MLATTPSPIHLLPTPTATPVSYLRHAFPIPQKAFVGLLACQRDPLLATLVTEVIRCDKRPPAPVVKGKKGKGVAVEEVMDEWEIELLDTVLFPEGGGQPSDVGTITPTSPEGLSSDGSPSVVREVLRRNLDAVHYVSSPLEVGTRVRVDLDVERRMDLMTQHTGQHLLSAVIDRDLQIDTLSWSLSPAPQPCYIELPRAPTADEIARIQLACNTLIAEGRAITIDMELAGHAGVETPDSVPSNYQGSEGQAGVVRTVNIDRLDRNPCCGTHFPSLSYLSSLFILPHTTSIRGTNARLSFLVGPRVLSHLSSSHSIVRGIAQELNCASTDLVERVAALQVSSRDAGRREKKLREEVAGFLGERLWSEAERNGMGVVSLREEDATNDLEFLTAVSFVLRTKMDALPAPVPHLFVLACGSSAGTLLASGALLVFGSDAEVAKAGKAVAATFGSRIKGGGKGKWQGKLSGRWERGDEKLLEEVLESAMKE